MMPCGRHAPDGLSGLADAHALTTSSGMSPPAVLSWFEFIVFPCSVGYAQTRRSGGFGVVSKKSYFRILWAVTDESSNDRVPWLLGRISVFE